MNHLALLTSPRRPSGLGRGWLPLLCLVLGCSKSRPTRLYVSNEGSGDVTVIDAAQGKVLTSIHVGLRPRGLHPSPDGKTLYVALSGSPAAGPKATEKPGPADRSADGIGVVDLGQQALIGRLPSGPDPEEFALDREGKALFISNEDAAAVSKVPTLGGQVAASIPVGDEPEGVSLSPDGRWVYVTCEAANLVSVVDTLTDQVVASIKVGARPRSTRFSADSSKAYVVAEVGASVTVVRLPQHEAVTTVKVPGEGVRPMGMVIAPDGKRAYISTGRGNSVAIFDLQTEQIVGSIAVGKRPWGIALSPDGRTLYTANGLSDDVSLVDLGSLRETGRIKVGSRPWGLAVVR